MNMILKEIDLAHSLDWPEDYKRGLVVVAHADDAEYGCSGTVARLIREGWAVSYTHLTLPTSDLV